MRTFTCLLHDGDNAVATLAVILAADEVRALELARRELAETRRPVALEVYEGDRLLFVEGALEHAPARGDGLMPRDVTKTINAQRIWLYGLRLSDARDDDERGLLQDLLVQEESRFGYYAEQLDIADAFLADAERRIRSQADRVEQLRGDGRDAALASEILEQFRRTAELFAVFRGHVEARLAEAQI